MKGDSGQKIEPNLDCRFSRIVRMRGSGRCGHSVKWQPCDSRISSSLPAGIFKLKPGRLSSPRDMALGIMILVLSFVATSPSSIRTVFPNVMADVGDLVHSVKGIMPEYGSEINGDVGDADDLSCVARDLR